MSGGLTPAAYNVMAITKQCESCRGAYRVTPGRAAKSRFCTLKCLHQGLSHDALIKAIIKKCERCGSAYRVRPFRAAKSRFCSIKCKRDGLITVNCKGCGREFSHYPSQAGKSYCSNACKYKFAFHRSLIKSECLHCGRAFDRRKKGAHQQTFCNRTCLHEYRRARVTKTCVECGNSYEVVISQFGSSKFCSRTCQNRSQGREKSIRHSAAPYREAAKLVRRAATQRHRALKRSAKGTFTRQQWLDKCRYHGWRCYLCGTDLDIHTAQVEHRIPLSRGGSNWIANLAPACSRCNGAKGSQTEKEYRAKIGAGHSSHLSEATRVA